VLITEKVFFLSMAKVMVRVKLDLGVLEGDITSHSH